MRRIIYAASLAIALCMAACTAPKKTIYFSESTANDPSVQVQQIERIKEIIILPDDVLAITVSTISALGDVKGQATYTMLNSGGTVYNIASTSGGGGGGTGENRGYMVDVDGFIDYPIIGKVKVSNLTVRQVKDLLADRLRTVVNDPVVEVRIINYRITVLGEVQRPGSIIAPTHKINILDAIAAAGDIPITGRKDNVLIIRETEGKREFARLNLNSRSMFSSPYYYLKQNDIIYVEPARIRRQESNDFLRFYLPTFTTLLSAALAVYGITQIAK